jgi:hypothetical protein
MKPRALELRQPPKEALIKPSTSRHPSSGWGAIQKEKTPTHRHTHTQAHRHRNANENRRTSTQKHARPQKHTGTHTSAQKHTAAHKCTQAHKCTKADKHTDTHRHTEAHRHTKTTFRLSLQRAYTPDICLQQAKADSTLRSSQAVPHPSTNRALCHLTSEVERDPVHLT